MTGVNHNEDDGIAILVQKMQTTGPSAAANDAAANDAATDTAETAETTETTENNENNEERSNA